MPSCVESKRDPLKPQNRLNPHIPVFCDLELIINEIAATTFAKRQKLNPSKIKEVWESMGIFIADSLRQMKGVVIPTLGTFHVGRFYDNGSLADANDFRPTFRLLDGRFAGVAQSRSRYRPAQRGRLVQPNFQSISRRCRLLRATCQRIVRDLLVQLGIHIVAGHQIKVDFPRVGKLQTASKGTLSFEFEAALLASFSRVEWDERPGVNPETSKQKAAMVEDLATEGINSGCVPRLMLERWLQREVRGLMDHLDAQTILDLLTVHTYGAAAFPISACLRTPAGQTKNPMPLRIQKNVVSDDVAGASLAPQLDKAEVLTLDDDPEQYDEEEEDQEEQDIPDQEENPQSEEHRRPGTPGTYYQQHKVKLASRKEVDEFNRMHFLRLHQARSKASIAPKVGNDPLNVEEVLALHNCLEEQHDPLRRPPSPDMRRRMARTSVRMNDDEGVLVPVPRPQPSTREQEDLRILQYKEKLAALTKKLRMRDTLQASWELQEEEKAKLDKMFRNSEEEWPYGPTHCPEVRRPLSGPHIALSTKMPAPMA